MDETWGFTSDEWIAVTSIGTVLYTVLTGAIALYARRAWKNATAELSVAEQSRKDANRPVLVTSRGGVRTNPNGTFTPWIRVRNIGLGPATDGELCFWWLDDATAAAASTHVEAVDAIIARVESGSEDGTASITVPIAVGEDEWHYCADIRPEADRAPVEMTYRPTLIAAAIQYEGVTGGKYRFPGRGEPFAVVILDQGEPPNP